MKTGNLICVETYKSEEKMPAAIFYKKAFVKGTMIERDSGVYPRVDIHFLIEIIGDGRLRLQVKRNGARTWKHIPVDFYGHISNYDILNAISEYLGDEFYVPVAHYDVLFTNTYMHSLDSDDVWAVYSDQVSVCD